MLPNPETNNFTQLIKEPCYLKLYDNEKRNCEPSKVAFTISFENKPKSLVESFDQWQAKKLGI